MTPPKCRNCGVSEWRHVCDISFSAVSRVAHYAKPTLKNLTESAPRAKPDVANRGVTNDVANSLERPARKFAIDDRAVQGQAAARGTSTERVKRWRNANRDAYNEAQRERMRARRAAAKAAQTAS